MTYFMLILCFVYEFLFTQIAAFNLDTAVDSTPEPRPTRLRTRTCAPACCLFGKPLFLNLFELLTLHLFFLLDGFLVLLLASPRRPPTWTVTLVLSFCPFFKTF